jgi:hypothetical protein
MHKYIYFCFSISLNAKTDIFVKCFNMRNIFDLFFVIIKKKLKRNFFLTMIEYRK